MITSQFTVSTAALSGVTATPIEITAKISDHGGFRGLVIHGISDAAARELRVILQAALAQLAHTDIDNRGLVVQVGVPGVVYRPDGLDLPIALAIVGVVRSRTTKVAAYGSLNLRGEVTQARGALAAVQALRSRFPDTPIVVPAGTVGASDVASGVVGARDLADAIRIADGDQTGLGLPRASDPPQYPDMKDVGALDGRQAVIDAARAGRNILIISPSGHGVPMLARRLAGALPPLTIDEAREVATIHDAAGHGAHFGRPFRAPHHSTTPPGLVGGGVHGRPGEVTLAHRGVLFLDELPEFSRAAIESLRSVVRDRRVDLIRRDGTSRLPADTLIVATAAPCACGRLPLATCTCSADTIAWWQSRIAERAKLLQLQIYTATWAADGTGTLTRQDDTMAMVRRGRTDHAS